MISVNASDYLEISGTDPIAKIPGSIRSESLASAKGGGIIISSPNLDVVEGGSILSVAYGTGDAGNLDLDITNSTQILGTSPRTARAYSNVNSISFGPGRPGDISVRTDRYIARDGGILLSATGGSGRGSDVNVQAKSSVELTGVEPITQGRSAISSSSSGSADAGSVNVSTPRVVLKDGGTIGSATIGSGSAGDVFINAPSSVEVTGSVLSSNNPSMIISSAYVLDKAFRLAFGSPDLSMLRGKAGTVKIISGKVVVKDGGQISVRNDGPADAGNLDIEAQSLLLDKGAITASTNGGEGGNIGLTINNLLLLRDGSSITTSAKQFGNGGNIIIDPNAVVLLGGSRISADAEQGLGGRVSLTTRGLFVSPDSSISATSARGPEFSGVVTINAPTQDFAKAATPPVAPPQAPEVSSVCQGRQGSSPSRFVKTGTGGIPRSPSDLLNKRSQWQEQPSAAAVQAAILDEPEDPEVQGWVVYPDRTMRFTAQTGVFYATSATVPCSSATATE